MAVTRLSAPRCALLLLALVQHGCSSAHGTSIATPAPSLPVAQCESSTVEPVPCECPVAEPTPECPVVQPTPPQPTPPQPTSISGTRAEVPARAAEVLDPTIWPPDVKGWYCYELRAKRGDKDYRSKCERTRAECVKARKYILPKKKRFPKAHFTPCRPYPQAACFTVQNLAEKYSAMHCVRTYRECLGSWMDMWEQFPEHTRSRCVELD